MTGSRPRWAAAASACLVALGIAVPGDAAARPGWDPRTPSPALPPVDAGFDYQLGGAYPPPPGTRIVTRDVTARPAARTFGICYVNAFQTQPGALSWWRREHPRLLLRDATGALVHDPGWPGEVLLDTSTRAKRLGLTAVVGDLVRRCARKGYRGVEPDNLDSFTRSRGLLTRRDNLALASRLAGIAHARRLAFAQKNLAGLGAGLSRRVGFDFAVAEDCQAYDECRRYLRVFGSHVLEIEYADNGPANFARACAIRGDRISVVYRDRMLRAAGHPGYVYRAC